MMRRFIALLLFAATLFASGCSSTQEKQEKLLYYRQTEIAYHSDGLIGSEPFPKGMPFSLENLTKVYFSGPTSESLSSPFPKGTEVISCTRKNNRLLLNLSDAFANLKAVDLSFAVTCIMKTFTQIGGVEVVEVYADGELLSGNPSYSLKEDQVLLQDNTLEIADTKITVYYADLNNRYLIPYDAKTTFDTLEEQAAYAVMMLGEEPESEVLTSTLPENTEILDLSVDNGTCTLDLTADFYRNRPTGEAAERMTILSIVNTLTAFDQIQAVQFFVEGEILAVYERMDLSLSYVREDSAIGPVRSGLSEVDASLYVLRERDLTLTEIPVRIKSAANETEADAVLSALIAYENPNGLCSPIPANTKVNSISEDGFLCTIDLSAAFAEGLNTEEEEQKAVWSIVESLLSLETIQAVRITIEGEEDGLQYVDLSKIYR